MDLVRLLTVQTETDAKASDVTPSQDFSAETLKESANPNKRVIKNVRLG